MLFAKQKMISTGNMGQLFIQQQAIVTILCARILLLEVESNNQLNEEDAVESFSLETKGESFQDEMFYLNFNTAKCQRDLIVVKL